MIGERIKKRRIELGMSLQELADKTGYSSRSTVQKIEAGSREVNQTKIVLFAQALKTTPQWLIEWDNEEPKEPVTDAELKFALFNGADGITDEMLEEVKKYAEFVKSRK